MLCSVRMVALFSVYGAKHMWYKMDDKNFTI